jgi:hypothetical protein
MSFSHGATYMQVGSSSHRQPTLTLTQQSASSAAPSSIDELMLQTKVTNCEFTLTQSLSLGIITPKELSEASFIYLEYATFLIETNKETSLKYFIKALSLKQPDTAQPVIDGLKKLFAAPNKPVLNKVFSYISDNLDHLFEPEDLVTPTAEALFSTYNKEEVNKQLSTILLTKMQTLIDSGSLANLKLAINKYARVICLFKLHNALTQDKKSQLYSMFTLAYLGYSRHYTSSALKYIQKSLSELSENTLFYRASDKTENKKINFSKLSPSDTSSYSFNNGDRIIFAAKIGQNYFCDYLKINNDNLASIKPFIHKFLTSNLIQSFLEQLLERQNFSMNKLPDIITEKLIDLIQPYSEKWVDFKVSQVEKTHLHEAICEILDSNLITDEGGAAAET